MAEAESEDTGNGFNLTIIIAVVVSVVLATGLSYFMMMRFGGLGGSSQEESSQEETKQENEVKQLGPTHSLEQFLVNLSGSNSYVKLQISVEVNNEDVIQEIQNRSPQIRDIIISILRSKRMEDIQGNPGVKSLRSEIRSEVNKNLANGKVTNVFFTEFVIQ